MSKNILRFYNINDIEVAKNKAKFLYQLAKGQVETWSSYVKRKQQEWQKILITRTQTAADGFPFTIVGLHPEKDMLIGSIYATKGFESFNSAHEIWIGGLYIHKEYRKQGLTPYFFRELMRVLINKGISEFYFFTVTKKLTDLYNNFYKMNLESESNLLGFKAYIHHDKTLKIYEHCDALIKSQNFDTSVSW